MTESRTNKSLKNAKVSLIYYFFQLILSFFSRKAFFDYLGSEILGLNTTASNLLGFLNLAELGVSAAVGYFLYQPLYDKDYTKLNILVSIQGWLYRKVAFIIISASIILMLFFPLIFKKSPLPISYAYLTFGVLLFSAMQGYFFNYKQIVLYADQKNYKIQQFTQGISILKTILQILFITFFPFPFFSWLTFEIIGSISTTLTLNYILKKEYPWLKTNISEGKKYIKKYPEVLKKTGQAFFHRIGGVILYESSPLIIYSFSSLTTVALYGNYLVIIGKVGTLIGIVFKSTGAAIGNLVASKDSNNIMKVFWELTDSRLCITTITLICLYQLSNPFITLWLGKEYCLGYNFLLLFIALNSINMTRQTVDSYINAFGLFNDIWAPIAESLLNLIFSITFGFFYGLNGVILGVLISQIIMISLWKPFFLFIKGFKIKASSYFIPITYRYSISIIIFLLTSYIFSYLKLENIDNIYKLLYNSVIIFFITSLVSSFFFYCFFKGFKDFILRIHIILKNKFA